MFLPFLIDENNDIAVFYKPPLLLTCPDRWDKNRENLMNIIHQKWSPNWFNAHRLDFETSGIIVCAKNKETLTAISTQFAERTVHKKYIAIVTNRPPHDNGRINLKIRSDEKHGRVWISQSEGSRAITDYTVLIAWRNHSLVIAEPITGRLHQIRVHFAASGFPVVCDSVYGKAQLLYLSSIKPEYKKSSSKETPLLNRLALHAFYISFMNPRDGKTIEIKCPLPHDMCLAIKYLNKFSNPLKLSHDYAFEQLT